MIFNDSSVFFTTILGTGLALLINYRYNEILKSRIINIALLGSLIVHLNEILFLFIENKDINSHDQHFQTLSEKSQFFNYFDAFFVFFTISLFMLLVLSMKPKSHFFAYILCCIPMVNIIYLAQKIYKVYKSQQKILIYLAFWVLVSISWIYVAYFAPLLLEYFDINGTAFLVILFEPQNMDEFSLADTLSVAQGHVYYAYFLIPLFGFLTTIFTIMLTHYIHKREIRKYEGAKFLHWIISGTK